MIVYTDKHGIPFEIDQRDWEVVRRYCWHINSAGYPTTAGGRWPKVWTLNLHVFLLGAAPKGYEIDHRDQNKLNNKRKNLRVVPEHVNQRNVGLRSTNRSGVKGVSWSKRAGKWRVDIRDGDVQRCVGYYASIEAAVVARKQAELRIWGNDGEQRGTGKRGRGRDWRRSGCERGSQSGLSNV